MDFSTAILLAASAAAAVTTGPAGARHELGRQRWRATGTESSSTGSGGPDDQTPHLEMDSFVVPAGGEVYKCQNFANPFGGANAEVTKFESHMTPGSHHLLLFYKKNPTDGPLEDCSGLEFAATPYSTQLPD